MSANQTDKDQIFSNAAEMQDPAQRAAYLQEVCGDDVNLRAEIEALLEHDQGADSFLDGPPSAVAATGESPARAESVGTRIGNYKLLQEIGEGGMGTVFLAEQVQPIKQRVALKIVKQGMDTRRFIARFEAERNALAMMDHPNIARVLDAGATETGRPYFVMELVKGIPITKFCDENELTARQRLGLFVDVCHAVQHAHQKGIIHRDLKPSNVLVALFDDRPVPKIIDFGVAKATNQQLTEKTLFTQIGQIVGTLEYMSPEQAVLNQLDVDTRADIYSLGVILYELLTGVTPIESDCLRSAGIEEMLRLIREEEPPKPSTRVSTLGRAAISLAAYRGTNVGTLAQTLRGDLDWIVMKALEKKRVRRYETANALAADLGRYLNDEPVEARPPSTLYRVSKFTRRNQALVGTLVAVGLALLLGIIGTSSAWISQRRIARELDEKTHVLEKNQRDLEKNEQALQTSKRSLEKKTADLQETVDALQSELTDRALNAAVGGDYDRAMDAIDKLKTADVSPSLRQTLEGLALFYSGNLEKAISCLRAATETDPNNASAWYVLAMALDRYGQYGESGVVSHEIESRHVEPRSDYDRLFQAQLNVVGTPKNDIIEQLNELISDHRSWAIAYTIRCKAWCDSLLETKDPSDAEHAIDDAKIALTLTPNNPLALTNGLIAYVRAIELKEFQGQDVTPLLGGAAELATALERWPKYVLGREMRATYYALIDRPDLVDKEDEALLKQQAGGYFAVLSELLKQDRIVELQRLGQQLEREDLIEAKICRPFILAMSSDEAAREEALQIFRTFDLNDMPYNTASIALEIPLLLGKPDTARRASLLFLNRELPPEFWVGWQWRVNYLAGRVQEQPYLDHAEPFRCCKAVADYTVAMQALADGDIKKAKQHFIVVIKTGKVSWWSYSCASAILACMDRDPSWPNWIPRRESGEPSPSSQP